MIKVVLIGSGNVAQHLIQVLLTAKEVDLVQAFARNPSHLSHLLPALKITADYQKIVEADFKKIEDRVLEISREKHEFKMREVSKADALALYRKENNPQHFHKLVID